MTTAAATIDGLLVVDKPSGATSHDVVARVRRLAGTRKVGHAGTLDPMATGVLVLGLGRATKLLGHLALTDKTYLATIRLGVATVTDDAEGDVVATTSATHLAEDAIREAARAFVGTIEQVPSSVSAVKQDGRHAYDRVRAGEDVVIPARTVTITRLDVADVRAAGEYVDLDVTVSCTSGTYVRAIARDLGTALGVGGHLTMLRRTRVGPFALDDPATVLAEPELSREVPGRRERGEGPAAEALLAAQRALLPLIPLGDAVAAAFPRVDVETDAVVGIANAGRAQAPPALRESPVAGPLGVFGPDGLLALMEQRGDTLRSLIVFAPANAVVQPSSEGSGRITP